MNKTKDNVWVGVEELNRDHRFTESLSSGEFTQLPIVEQSAQQVEESKGSRRDFLKYLGFGIGAATVAASCDIPVKHAVPYTVLPTDIVPGVASYYASAFVKGGDFCSVLVKTREGRPIKIEGNSLCPITQGGTSARAQASVLDLYNTSRYQQPIWERMVTNQDGDDTEAKMVRGGVSWAELDKAVAGELGRGSIRILTNTILSPTAKRAVQEFVTRYPGTRVATYDPVSSSAMLQANKADYQQLAIPDYHFDRADVVVSFGADYLGTWVSPVEYATDWVKKRRISGDNPSMSYCVTIESGMSLTGSNSDNRIMVKPSEQGVAIAALAAALGVGGASSAGLDSVVNGKIQQLATRLRAAGGRSIVVSGSNNIAEQQLINRINDALGNYGRTMTWENASLQRQGIDSSVRELVREMNAGQVGTLILMDDVNPAYDLPDAGEFVAGMAKVGTRIALHNLPNETTQLCNVVAPNHHYLESWGDAEPKRGIYSVIQPTINPIFRTRQQEETLLRWANSTNLDVTAEMPYYEYLKNNWTSGMMPTDGSVLSARNFWDSLLHDGVFTGTAGAGITLTDYVGGGGSRISQPATGELEISFPETVNIGSGNYYTNPWLQEMPDPINRCVWGNYLSIPVEFDGDRRFVGSGAFAGLNEDESMGLADMIGLSVNKNGEAIPAMATVVRQFGQKKGTVSLPVGYGRTAGGKITENGAVFGTNVYPWLWIDADGNTQYYNTEVALTGEVENEEEFACVQYHDTMGLTGTLEGETEKVNLDEIALMELGKGYQGALVDRSIIRQAHVDDVAEFVDELHHEREHHQKLNDYTLYPWEEYSEMVYDQGHKWGMHVDLNACIGCGACEVACVAENNVPVVGKFEVFRHHEMKWIRIDRYFYGDAENPNVVYQPMMCQHCDNAPCENVCPVAATNHSSEGLNQMTYNRCIGTRYCANNCPYKVRRFNWLDYTTADIFPANEPKLADEDLPFGADNLMRMVLNPDVTVRSRGVIEKCSFCVQRIQEGKLMAKREQRSLRDGDVKTACQTACPTGAITFGDVNNKDSKVIERMDSPLNYIVLEEINVRPSVMYSAKIHNRDEEMV